MKHEVRQTGDRTWTVWFHLNTGRLVTIDFDHEPTENEVNEALDRENERPRVLWHDFNSNEVVIPWGEAPAREGDRVLLVDGEWNSCEATVTEALRNPDRLAFSNGFVLCALDMSTWFDGEDAIRVVRRAARLREAELAKEAQ